MAHVLLIGGDGKARPAYVKMLVGAGHLVSIAPDWMDGLSRAGEDFDIIVVDYAGDIAAAGTPSLLGQLRSRRAVPVLALASAQECRRLRSRTLTTGVRAVPRMALLEELRALERRGGTDTVRRTGTDQVRRSGTWGRQGSPTQSSSSIMRGPETTSSTARDAQTTGDPFEAATHHGDTVTLDVDSPLSQFRAADEVLAAGTVVDKYRIEALVGRGGFAHVYRAMHLVLGMPVALKVLKPSLAASEPTVVETFCTEARNAIRISHPNVVRVHDVTRGERLTWLVMEWLEGVSLSDVLGTTGRIPASEALRIGIAVCNGLEAALAHGTIHRDVKPGNILLGNDGTVKLVDFGLAKNLRQTALQGHSDAGRVVGTPLYMSPEQAFEPDAVDCRADMYSLGATLFHACAGTPPYEAEEPVRILLRHRDSPVPILSARAPDVPDELSGLVARLMAKEPSRRFPSYAELRKVMTELLASMAVDGEVASNGWSNWYQRKRAPV